MDLKTNSPSEIAQIWVANGISKSKLSGGRMLLLGILAGAYIGFGAVGYLFMMGNYPNPGLNKLLGAAVFPCGLMLVIYAGAELWTGNNLMTLALLDKKITFGAMLKSWGLVYLGNAIGSYLLAAAVAATGLFSKDPALSVVAGVATAKVGLSFGQAFTRAVLCNALVVLACWVQAASKDLIGKILSMWFPVMLFVLAGFEHSIANMFFIPLGQFLGAEITFAQTWLGNILPVTLGNFVGGAVIVPCAYYAAYLAGAKAEKAQSPAQKKKK